MSEIPEALRLADDFDRDAKCDLFRYLELDKAADELRRQHAEIERLREALKLALNSHGRMLMSDPPQDPWKVNRVDEVIRELLQEDKT